MTAGLSLAGRLPLVAEELRTALASHGPELAAAALAIARVEYPALDAAACIATLDRLGAEAAARVERAASRSVLEAVVRLNDYLYDEQGFRGNSEHYDDARNSFLNEVLDRRMGIPISLGTVYMEVGRRAGLDVEGVNFPGHFLLRVAVLPDDRLRSSRDYLIIDPFNGGALLDEDDCRELLRQRGGDDDGFDRRVLARASRRQIVTRMLVNLKRLYVRMRSFPQARFVSELLLMLDPSSLTELRDRGLLAYHVDDLGSALRDLESYLRQVPKGPSLDALDSLTDDERMRPASEDDVQIWEQVKTLRRRVTGFN